MTSTAAPGLTRLNGAPDATDGDGGGAATAGAMLREVCASRAWAAAVAAGRPYAGLDDLLAASDRAMAALTDADLDEAVSGHPPIGRPAPGDPV